jgi:DNA-binding response OmpR family regulator
MRVLVVEDDQVLAELVAEGLRDQDMVVNLAHDGLQALGRTATLNYDVIILDRDLPMLHGDVVCQALVKQGNSARILMLTSAAAVDDRVDGLMLGADDYLGKPFAFSELVARVTSWFGRFTAGVPFAAISPVSGSAWRSWKRSPMPTMVI